MSTHNDLIKRLLKVCNGTATEAAYAIAALVAERDALRDCRTCAHFTNKSGGCVALVQCVNAAQYKATTPRQYWQIVMPAR